jgi:hypothetical protein
MRAVGKVSRSTEYRRKQTAKELGIPVDQIPDLRGVHGKHARGKDHPRYNEGHNLSEHGYMRVQVGKEHPLSDPNGYAYEHLIVWVSAGMPKPGPGEIIHHKDENKTNNRIGNLEVKTRPDHGKHHAALMERDSLGRFV